VRTDDATGSELEAPPVPGLASFAWLLFMQPIRLHDRMMAWGLPPDVGAIGLWRRARQGHAPAREVGRRCLALLWGVMPVIAVAVAVGRWLLEGDSSRVSLAIGVASAGLAGGLTWVALDSVRGPATGLMMGALSPLVLDGGGSTSNAAFGAALGLAVGANFHGPERHLEGPMVAVVLAVASGLLFGVVGGVLFGAPVGVVFGGTATVGILRLPVWGVEAAMTLVLSRRMSTPDRRVALARWLPHQHDDLITFPLPGLMPCLLAVAEVEPSAARELLARAAASRGQAGVARRTLIELRRRALEQAVRTEAFLAVAGLDLPFLPTEEELARAEHAAVRPFRDAAKDLVLDGQSQRARQHALARAVHALEHFQVATTAAKRPGDLDRHLLPTAQVWLDYVHHARERLERETRKRPEVPSVFVAGLALTPAIAEQRGLFKGRRDVIDLLRHDLAPDRRGVLLIVGQRRIGKSSLCNWLSERLGTDTTVVVSNFQRLTEDDRKRHPHRRLIDDVAASLPWSAELAPSSTAWGEALAWLRTVDAELGERRLLVVIDEVERIEDGIVAGWCTTDVLDFLRAAGEDLLRIRFLLLSAYTLRRLGRHWTDRLISVTVRPLSYLADADARELICLPVDDFPAIYPEGGVERIVAATRGHPYLVQKTCDNLVKLLNARGGLRLATDAELTEALDKVVQEGDHVFLEAWDSPRRTDAERATLLRLATTDGPGQADGPAVELARDGYVVLDGESQASIAVPLLRDWIRLYQRHWRPAAPP
jgi:hypothetical protein